MKKINKHFFYLFTSLAILNSFYLKSQDIHFSQFYFNPLSVNPAHTGFFQGDYRIITNYKNQWQSIINPYRTAFASVELSLPVKRIGIGMSFFNDKAGKSKMGITKGDLSASYTLRANSSNSIATGLQFGFGQQSIRTNDLKWDSQFNGVLYDPTLPSGENQLANSNTFIDVSGGTMWDYSNKYNQLKINVGAAMYHINQPIQSFYNNSDAKLLRKLVCHLNGQIKLIDKQAFLLPQFIYFMQGPYQEMDAGLLFKYIIGVDNASELVYVDKWTSSAVYLGGQYRFKDAFVACAAFELQKSLLIGFSYDINISKLRVASDFRGGMEITLRYKGAFN